jgi:single-strand DNA-binding protein
MVVTLSVATRKSWKSADGEWQSHTEWHPIVLFGSRLAAYGRILAKGSHVMVQGSVRTREYKKTVCAIAF